MDNEDPLAPARGCLFGILIGTGIWAVAVSIWMIVWRVLHK
jgi:hypothetical protein